MLDPRAKYNSWYVLGRHASRQLLGCQLAKILRRTAHGTLAEARSEAAASLEPGPRKDQKSAGPFRGWRSEGFTAAWSRELGNRWVRTCGMGTLRAVPLGSLLPSSIRQPIMDTQRPSLAWLGVPTSTPHSGKATERSSPRHPNFDNADHSTRLTTS
eukprot:s3559_g6.t1